MRFRREPAVEVRGFLDEGTEVIGDLRFSDVLHLHGRIKGRVVSDGELVVGQKGVIEGDVEVGILTLGGTLIGNVIAKKKVHFLNTARIRGDVSTPILRVDEGAEWEGSITTLAEVQEKSPEHMAHAAGEVEAAR
ncbi:MAG: polymer-forming cytoskeletal protein [Blastocatellia bacterium]|nr:polymer-forming cytoskeletal protein [Blastocatellia bacterium]MCS7158104.1 polymer-forming cytoskeletal protein [Blastocatellia bacterium]MCX7753033.1 polymer-forming cytoskeletal protein [Blastocatellia bacterium]MDW8168556.1 polymer-forming cytoskeletal protein [Acidobacteriota bacterium]MDW8257281.1 polymer-forming cytoskeletal protein [Acidobacteriota bacterium]